MAGLPSGSWLLDARPERWAKLKPRRGLPRNDLTDSLYRMPGRTLVSWFPRGASGLAALVIALVLLLGTPFTARASLLKPAYAAGDKWVYILDGSITEFPGLNASQILNLRFDLVGMVDVKVIGPANVVPGIASVPAARVDTRGTGYLDGPVSLPGGATTRGC